MTFRIKARGTGDLKTRYRPQRLNEICPTFSITEAKAILENKNASQVYLFEGGSGTGKTSLARIIARASVCTSEEGQKPCLECTSCRTMESSPDFTEINVADFRGIDAVRDQTRDMGVYGGFLSRKIFIYDESQQLSPAAQELLNKTLEEPKGGILIFLCTTNMKGLKRTLVSRCSRINFSRITREQCNEIVRQVMEDEGKKMLNRDTTEDLFMRADGSVRDLLNLLEKVLLGTYKVGQGNTQEDEEGGSPDIFRLVRAYKEKDWETVRELLNTEYIKNDPDGYRETVCSFLAREAINNPLDMRIATALGHLGGSLYEEPKREQYSLFVLRSMRACYQKKD